ncbi:MAG: Hpt domain-containing protein [Pelagibaca sp.]
MVDRGRRSQGAKPLHDADIFGEALSVFGKEGVRAHLHALQTELMQLLTAPEPDFKEPQTLRDTAHRIAGRSGMLGLSALSYESALLEQAIRLDREIAPIWDRWKTEARRGVAFIETERMKP